MATPRARPRLQSTAQLGRRAEDAVARWLAERGWRVLARNVRVGHLEIDLLCRRDDLVAVVEVRYRGAGSWRGPFESVDTVKRTRLREAARRIWLERFEHDASVAHMRIDVAAVRFTSDGEAEIEVAEGQWW